MSKGKRLGIQNVFNQILCLEGNGDWENETQKKAYNNNINCFNNRNNRFYNIA